MSDPRSTSLETGRQTAKSREPGEGHSRQVRTQRPSSPCGRREALAAMGASASKWPHGYWPLPEDLSATWDPPSRRLEAGATSLAAPSALTDPWWRSPGRAAGVDRCPQDTRHFISATPPRWVSGTLRPCEGLAQIEGGPLHAPADPPAWCLRVTLRGSLAREFPGPMKARPGPLVPSRVGLQAPQAEDLTPTATPSRNSGTWAPQWAPEGGSPGERCMHSGSLTGDEPELQEPRCLY
ncbi:uncharacterized protein DKFZp434B061-like isoform X1 [Cervus canadensis]|uniref:uncharacterized protein DKFZp434B061-like isoform X1 n=1 Tax=Cervus canadensis TaxID=1574408 RepID=UPI001C9E3814|nr:uncharacterized protein DKFZp434B061-like isoform X1 [Cervus canadensis]XP_043341330.1 uncharacterized protein DKFZp434B061-like isoform X1 [Cervus canadensis]